MSESENNPLFSSFVGVQYLVCECGEAFENEESLSTHLERRHPLRQKINVRHLMKVPPPITEYKCGECGQIYATEEACVQHQEVDHIPFMEEVEIHHLVDQDIEDAIIPDVIIPSTSQSCSAPASNTPVRVRVQSLPSTISHQDPPQKKRQKKKRNYQHKNVQCETCGKKYASNAALRYHQRVHTGVKPYQCPYCPKAFTMALFMQIHIRTHTGEKPYNCEECPKAFGNRAALLRHNRVHTGIKPYQCPKCNKCFTQSNSMKLHYHTVHLKLPTPYKSKRRQAETDARERKARQSLTDSESESKVQLMKSVMQEPDENHEVYYVKTPSGRQITLTTIVPKKTQQQLVNEENIEVGIKEETQLEDSEPFIKPEAIEVPIIEECQDQLQEGEIYYYDIKPEAIEEDVAYEVIYE